MFAQSVWLSNYQCENCSMSKTDKRSWNSKSRTSCNPQCSHPCNAVMPDNNQQTDILISGNYCITTDELCSTSPTHNSSVMALTEELGCSKICVRWVPQMLIDAHKKEGKASHWPCAPTWYNRWGLPAAVCHSGRNLGPPIQTQIQVAVTGVVAHDIPKEGEIVRVSLQHTIHVYSLLGWERCDCHITSLVIRQ
jgi:hypothetical protein